MSLDNRHRLPPLLTVLLANVQSIRNKTDELEAWTRIKGEIKGTCLLTFTQTWLSDSDHDEVLSSARLAARFGWTTHRRSLEKHEEGESAFTLTRGTVTLLLCERGYALLILNFFQSLSALIICLVSSSSCFLLFFTFISGAMCQPPLS